MQYTHFSKLNPQIPITGGLPNLNSGIFRTIQYLKGTIWFSVAKPKQYIVFHPRYKIPHTMFRVPCTMSVHCYLSKTSSMYYVGFTFRNRQRTQYIVWCTRLNIVFYVVYQVENYVGSGTANTHQKNTIWCGTYHVLFRFGHPPYATMPTQNMIFGIEPRHLDFNRFQ